METDTTEQMHLTVPSEMHRWILEYKVELGMTSNTSVVRHIIMKYRENQHFIGKSATKSNLKGWYILSSMIFTAALFVAGRMNGNDPLLYYSGFLALGCITLYALMGGKNVRK